MPITVYYFIRNNNTTIPKGSHFEMDRGLEYDAMPCIIDESCSKVPLK